MNFQRSRIKLEVLNSCPPYVQSPHYSVLRIFQPTQLKKPNFQGLSYLQNPYQKKIKKNYLNQMTTYKIVISVNKTDSSQPKRLKLEIWTVNYRSCSYKTKFLNTLEKTNKIVNFIFSKLMELQTTFNTSYYSYKKYLNMAKYSSKSSISIYIHPTSELEGNIDQNIQSSLVLKMGKINS